MPEVDEDDNVQTYKTANAATMENEKEEEPADIDTEKKREGSDTDSADKVAGAADSVSPTDDPVSPADDPVSLKRPRKKGGKEEEPKTKTRSSVRDPVPRTHYSNEQEDTRAKVETEKKASKSATKPKSNPKQTKQGSYTLWFKFTH